MATNMCTIGDNNYVSHCRMWFQFHPLRASIPAEDWIGDDIYLAVILFGVGGTALSVVGLTHLSLLVGENTVSAANQPQEGISYNHTQGYQWCTGCSHVDMS